MENAAGEIAPPDATANPKETPQLAPLSDVADEAAVAEAVDSVGMAVTDASAAAEDPAPSPKNSEQGEATGGGPKGNKSKSKGNKSKRSKPKTPKSSKT